jgi:DNA-binding LacI/PurR family transcriptional regulator
MDYSPSRSARSLRSSKTRTIGFLANNFENTIVYEHLQATIRAAFNTGYTILVADGQGSADIQDAELKSFREYRVDGIILGRSRLLITDGLLDLVSSGIPVEPEPWPPTELAPPKGSLTSPFQQRWESDRAAATIAYRALVELGHRNIAFLRQRRALAGSGNSRVTTLREVLKRSGPKDHTVTVVEVAEPIDCTAELQLMAAAEDRPTALVCGSGLLTPYALEGLHAAGLRMPSDISFLCYGDSIWHRGYVPALSVIRHDYAAAAHRDIERLVARIEGRDMPEIARRPSEFVRRGSIAQAPGQYHSNGGRT